MKYVIELPEYIKHEVDIEEDVDKAEDFIKWYSATLTCAIKDSTPLQAEFEEIKTDIHLSTVTGITGKTLVRVELVDEIIDKRIAELKGENK